MVQFGTEPVLKALMELKADFKELKADIKELMAEVKADIKELKAEVKADIKELKAEVKADFKADNKMTRDILFMLAMLLVLVNSGFIALLGKFIQ